MTASRVSGFHQRGRLDLTVEASVGEHATWHALCTREDLDKARRRLIAYGYAPREPNVHRECGGNSMSETVAMNGAEWLARALAGTGMSHVFFVESTLRRTLLHLSDLGVRPILAHSEKAAAYMADGYARVAGRPGVCMAQSVGAANLAAGLQDAWLGRSPVIALSGRKEPSLQHRNAYQEIPHASLFAAVTKFSRPVQATADLPRLLRQAWRT